MAQQIAENGHRPARVRSPAYPSIDLETAVSRVGMIYKHEKRNAAPVAVAVSHCGLDIKSSSGLRTIAALKQFGLLDDEGAGDDRRVKLSPLALDVVLAPSDDDEARMNALKQAALNPKIHKLVWAECTDGLPSDQNLKSFLIRKLEFNDAAAVPFIKQFKRTIAFANLSPSGMVEEWAEPENGHIEGDTMDNPKPPPAQRPGSQTSPSWAAPSAAGVRELPITLPSLNIAVLRVPFPMDQADYEALESSLKAFKDALTKQS